MQNSFPHSLFLRSNSGHLPPAVICSCVSVNEAVYRFELLLKLQQFIFDTFLGKCVCVGCTGKLLWYVDRQKPLQGIFLTFNLLAAAGKHSRQLHSKM